MKLQTSFAVVALGISPGLCQSSRAAQFAAAVVAYNPGAGAAAGYTNAAAALGEPSRTTPGAFGGPVDPFDPAYTRGQLVSIGAGGSLTIQFDPPLAPAADHPYGLDFMIFSGSGFIITNATDASYNYIGTPATDGSLFSTATGPTRVSVSPDGTTFYQLDAALAPPAAGLFPTDGSGDFSVPVDPSLGAAAFAGEDLPGIHRLYGGSGGGAGYSLQWARDGAGHPVNLASASQVRVEVGLDVVGGRVQVDAFSAVEAPPAPPLFISRAGGSIVIHWPSWAAGYSLETSAAPQGAPWRSVAASGTSAVVPISGSAYFRLRR